MGIFTVVVLDYAEEDWDRQLCREHIVSIIQLTRDKGISFEVGERSLFEEHVCFVKEDN